MCTEFVIHLIGLNHRTAPVEVREKLSFKDRGVHPLDLLKSEVKSFKEAYFLSTCNRVEFYFVLLKDNRQRFFNEFTKFMEKEVGLPWSKMQEYFYFMDGEEAIKHLFEVACGLDSMVLGEPQIFGQVKQAYREALEHRTSGLVLNKLLHRCFFVAKRVRTETGIGGGAVSISYAAYELAKKILGSLKGRTILLVGAGEMAELACMHFISAGIERVLIANRTLSRAVELAKRFKGEAYSLEELSNALIKADVVISSTGAPHFVITKKMISGILKPRKFKPLFIIDIAVPRDVEPEVNQLENVYLYDIDDLKEVVEENLKERQKEAFRAKVIVEEEVLKFKHWLKELDLHPTIRALTEKIEDLRQKELARTLKKLKHLSDKDKEALEVLTKSLVQKILFYPIQFMKSSTEHDKGRQAISTVREMFRLDEEVIKREKEPSEVEARSESETSLDSKTSSERSSEKIIIN